jgi:hypothetical protein
MVLASGGTRAGIEGGEWYLRGMAQVRALWKDDESIDHGFTIQDFSNFSGQMDARTQK